MTDLGSRTYTTYILSTVVFEYVEVLLFHWQLTVEAVDSSDQTVMGAF